MQEVVALEEFTPDRAAEALRHADPVNVRIAGATAHAPTVQHLATIMRSGCWNPNGGDPVVFDRAGKLAGGYRRMHACIQSNTPFRTYVVRYVE
jgi:hypothetical protein